jgi:hypothetical protein
VSCRDVCPARGAAADEGGCQTNPVRAPIVSIRRRAKRAVSSRVVVYLFLIPTANGQRRPVRPADGREA